MTKVEEVARAIAKALRWDLETDDCDRGHDEPWREEFLDAARAAIEAMRVPTPEMVKAADKAEVSSASNGIYDAMIDAALTEEQ